MSSEVESVEHFVILGKKDTDLNRGVAAWEVNFFSFFVKLTYSHAISWQK